MTIPFTSVVYFPVALAIGFISFRFYNEWKETETRDNLIYALAFTALTIVCSTGVLAGTIFSSKEGIVLMLVVSSIFVAIANGFYSYLFLYYRFPRISPWLGFT
ncbi:MAG TPA: hypothetical protein ENJ89_09505, partial [Caldithrix abyssi]|nr:hypothetical protein [Caldithrix abyssi]